MFRPSSIVLAWLLLLAVSPLSAEVTVEPVADGIEVPWGMLQMANGDLLVTERSGALRLIRDGQLLEQPITGLPEIAAFGQGGLLDIALHPDYADNGWLYISYVSPAGDGKGANTAVMRAKLDGMRLTDQQLLYKAEPNSKKPMHFGGRLVVTDDGYLFFSIGDRGQRDVNPQDLSRAGGKIYRLHDDGRVPADNPFVGKDAAIPAIYTYGNRNPQGMAIHPDSGKVWSHEHGPKGGDEVNIIEPGVNYGWPVISYGINYWGTKFTELTAKPGMAQPAWYWDPSIAPSGMVFVTSPRYPQWQGKLLVGSLKFNYLALLTLDGEKITEQQIVMKEIGRVRSLMQGNDGYLYVGLDGEGVVRLEP